MYSFLHYHSVQVLHGMITSTSIGLPYQVKVFLFFSGGSRTMCRCASGWPSLLFGHQLHLLCHIWLSESSTNPTSIWRTHVYLEAFSRSFTWAVCLLLIVSKLRYSGRHYWIFCQFKVQSKVESLIFVWFVLSLLYINLASILAWSIVLCIELQGKYLSSWTRSKAMHLSRQWMKRSLASCDIQSWSLLFRDSIVVLFRVAFGAVLGFLWRFLSWAWFYECFGVLLLAELVVEMLGFLVVVWFGRRRSRMVYRELVLTISFMHQ